MTPRVTHNGEPYRPRQVYHGRAREKKTGRMREDQGKGGGTGGRQSYREENREEQSAEGSPLARASVTRSCGNVTGTLTAAGLTRRSGGDTHLANPRDGEAAEPRVMNSRGDY